MEILSFLRLSRRRVVALTLVAGLAGAGAGAYAYTQPTSYEANATVFVGQALPDNAGSFDIAPLAADFQAALGLDSVVLATSEEAEVPRTDFTFTSARNGDGSTVSVVATGPTAQKAELVARTVSTKAMGFVTGRRVERAAALVAARQTELQTATDAVRALDVAVGYIDPVQKFNTEQLKAIQLRSQSTDPSTDLTAAQRALLAAEADRIQQTLPGLHETKVAYEAATKAQLVAQTNLDTAQEARAAAESIGRAATSVEAVSTDPATPVSSTPAIMRAAGAGVLVAVLAAVGLLWLIDDRRRRQDEARAQAMANPPAAPPELADLEPIEGDPFGFAEADAELAEGYYDDGEYVEGYDDGYEGYEGDVEGADGDEYPDVSPHAGEGPFEGQPYAEGHEGGHDAQVTRDGLTRSVGRR